MTELTAESILDKISRDHLKCAICLDTLQDPRLLRCLHSFCKSCLDHLLDREQINCPTCRSTTSMKRKNTCQLRKNFSLASLVDDVKKDKKHLQEQDEILMHSDHQDPWFDREKCHTGHTVGVLTCLNHEEKVPHCDQHQDMYISFYCNTCRVMICAMCAAIDHRGKDHDYVPLEEAESAARQQLSKLLSRCKERQHEVIMERSLIEGERHMVEIIIFQSIRSIQQTKLHQFTQNDVIHHLEEFQKVRQSDFTNALSTADATTEWINHIWTTISNTSTEPNKYNLLKQMDHLTQTAEQVINQPVTIPKLLPVKLCLSKSDTGAEVVINKKDCHTDEFGQDTPGLFYEIKVLGYKWLWGTKST